ncbi:MAG: hypothetical protein Q8L88_11465 [Bacteroidota bacterium]|nr:hypothetical protein [Bacteroidota bacterium]
MKDPINLSGFLLIQIVLSVLFSFSLFSQEQGKIRGFDDEAKIEKKDTTHSEKISSSPTSTSSDDISIDDASIAIEVVGFFAVAIGYVVVGTLIKFPGEDSSVYDNTFWTRGFTEYPYSNPEQGMFSQASNKTFAFFFSGHRFFDGNNLTGYSGRLFVSPHQSFNLEAHIVDLSEKLKTKTDHLRFYNFFIDYNRIKSERFSVWWGLGMKGMNGPTVNKTGFALNSGFEIFPVAPISIMTNYNIGFINKNSLQEFLFAGNFYINRYNFSFGYQCFTVGAPVLDGMILGMTFHF